MGRPALWEDCGAAKGAYPKGGDRGRTRSPRLLREVLSLRQQQIPRARRRCQPPVPLCLSQERLTPCAGTCGASNEAAPS